MLNSSIEIREAVPADAKKLNQYLRIIFATSDHLITTADEFRVKPIRQRLWIAQKATNPYEICLIATQNKQVVGMLDSWTDTRKRVRHVSTFAMSVHPDSRKQGIGEQLLRRYIGFVAENPRLQKIELHVHENNAPAHALYEKLGFIVEGVRKAAICTKDNHFIDDVLMAYWPNSSSVEVITKE